MRERLCQDRQGKDGKLPVTALRLLSYKVTGPERNVYMRQQALDSPRTLRRCEEYVSMEYNVSASVCVATRVCRVAPCLVRSERQASEPTASCCTFATLGSGPDHFRRRATCM